MYIFKQNNLYYSLPSCGHLDRPKALDHLRSICKYLCIFGKISKYSTCLGCFQIPEAICIMKTREEQRVPGSFLLVVSLRESYLGSASLTHKARIKHLLRGFCEN